MAGLENVIRRTNIMCSQLQFAAYNTVNPLSAAKIYKFLIAIHARKVTVYNIDFMLHLSKSKSICI